MCTGCLSHLRSRAKTLASRLSADYNDVRVLVWFNLHGWVAQVSISAREVEIEHATRMYVLRHTVQVHHGPASLFRLRPTFDFTSGHQSA